MEYYLLIVIFCRLFLLINSQATTDTSVTDKPWFWPLIGVVLALVLSVPSTVIILVFICYTKHKSHNNSDESNASDSGSFSSLPDRRLRNSASRHTERFHSPPPPYTSCEPPRNVFIPPIQLPGYESSRSEVLPIPPSTATTTTTILLPVRPITEPVASPTAQTEVSSTLTSPSIQTFQV